MAVQASAGNKYPMIHVPFRLCRMMMSLGYHTPHCDIRYHSPQEEIALGPACWLWDYLRRSGMQVDISCLSFWWCRQLSAAAIVGSMCQLATAAVSGDEVAVADVRRIAQIDENDPIPCAKELAHLFCFKLSTWAREQQRCNEKSLLRAAEIGASHLDVRIDTVVAAVVAFFTSVTQKTPKFRVDGGSNVENLALQNIQARIRLWFFHSCWLN